MQNIVQGKIFLKKLLNLNAPVQSIDNKFPNLVKA